MLGHLPVASNFDLYGALGVTSGEVNVTASVAGTSATETNSDSGLSYGIGANIRLFDAAALNIEYMHYLSESDYDISALSAGLTFTF